jgi:ribosomal protein S6
VLLSNAHMVAKKEVQESETILRVYEVGYHVSPSVKEEDVEKVVAEIRDVIEKAGGVFIAEGAPAHAKLSYPISIRHGEKYTEYDRAFFGWIKFETTTEVAAQIDAALKAHRSIIRHIVFKTVREDTRAKLKVNVREVRRTDTLRATARKPEETEKDAAPVSEAELDKALETLIAE